MKVDFNFEDESDFYAFFFTLVMLLFVFALTSVLPCNWIHINIAEIFC